MLRERVKHLARGSGSLSLGPEEVRHGQKVNYIFELYKPKAIYTRRVQIMYRTIKFRRQKSRGIYSGENHISYGARDNN